MPTTSRRTVKRSSTQIVRRSTRAHSPAAVVATWPVAPVLRIHWDDAQPKLLALALAVALIAALVGFFNTDQFYLYDVQVTGSKYLAKTEIEKAAGVIGYNIFFVETPTIERSIGKLPEVKSVRVTTSLPNHLGVQVVERKPELVWVRGNEPYWVDADGISFKARTNIADMTFVRDLDQTAVTLGQPVRPGAVAAVLALRDAWSVGTTLSTAPRVLEFSTAHGLGFNDERGWKVYLGDASHMGGKLAEYRAVTAQLVSQNVKIRFIDLGKGDPYYQ